jgi:hypothetical protein
MAVSLDMNVALNMATYSWPRFESERGGAGIEKLASARTMRYVLFSDSDQIFVRARFIWPYKAA